MKKILVCIFFAMLLLASVTVVSVAGDDGIFPSGDGTADDPYRVATADESLKQACNELASEIIASANSTLMRTARVLDADTSANSNGFEPKGSFTKEQAIVTLVRMLNKV